VNPADGTRVAKSPASRRLRGAILKEAEMLYLTTRMLSMFRREEDGQDLLEYALLVALIAIVAVAAVTAAGVKVDAIFKDIVSKLPS
jgi:Flp pilus assembly pilin Flp